MLKNVITALVYLSFSSLCLKGFVIHINSYAHMFRTVEPAEVQIYCTVYRHGTILATGAFLRAVSTVSGAQYTDYEIEGTYGSQPVLVSLIFCQIFSTRVP